MIVKSIKYLLKKIKFLPSLIKILMFLKYLEELKRYKGKIVILIRLLAYILYKLID
jgi:hypothetical protein